MGRVLPLRFTVISMRGPIKSKVWASPKTAGEAKHSRAIENQRRTATLAKNFAGMWAIFMNSTAFNFVPDSIRIKPAPEYYETFLSGRPGQQRALIPQRQPWRRGPARLRVGESKIEKDTESH